ncbi:MAG TPA: M28 family peptidase [Kofleriaceae bacterium]|nr:M28 family peptidase [Kofleriaceae bacterium]
MSEPWDQIEDETRGAFHGAGKFPLRAYSEAMPPPYVGFKPYAPQRAKNCSTFGCSLGHALDIDEYEQAFDLEPGLDRIGKHLVDELAKLVHGQPHALSKTLLDGNPAWPAELAVAAKHGKLAHDPLLVIASVALSRTQDDKGNERWTLFGGSHDGPARAFWHGMTEAGVTQMLAWAGIKREWKTFGGPFESREGIGDVVVTFEPFAKLPDELRARYLAGKTIIVPTPASLVFFEHPQYRRLAAQLPRAMQVPLLHLFPRIEQAYAIRIPQSGWLDEVDPATSHHKVVGDLVRTHRWQRIARDEDIHGDGAYTDKVSVALFSTEPVAVDLYDKPLARNSQIWNERYELVLDGWPADRAQLARAAAIVDRGGRFGYRMYYPPMRAGVRELFWHVPVIANAKGRYHAGPRGYIGAEREGSSELVLEPNLLARSAHVAAAREFAKDPGRSRHTTAHNIRKLLEARALLGKPLAPSHARSLLHCAKHDSLEHWLASLPKLAAHPDTGQRVGDALTSCIGEEPSPPVAHVLAKLGTREFEDAIWKSIVDLAHGEFIQKNDSDGITVNKGKHGGPAAKAAHVVTHERRDLEALGDHLHARYRALIAKHGIGEVVDHAFKWETDFEFAWMEGWAKNQTAPAERNIVMMIPGKNRGEAIVMGDHYDTAYMEDVYYKESGGDLLRAPACGADDNHSATTALLLCAEQLLPLAKAGKLERDVWLIHLTGEEFPPDCLGARALCQGLVEKSLQFTAEDGTKRDVGHVDVVGAFVLDMVGHNADRDRDVFQIAPGEGEGSAKLARRANRANLAWNRLANEWNDRDRKGLDRARRMPFDPKQRLPSAPPPFAHLPLHGEIRVEWEPRSALYNTDGQVFSDVGIPVVLFMENYDISRKGYHDTHDTMENIDLDYCAALTAIAIETVADCACAPSI